MQYLNLVNLNRDYEPAKWNDISDFKTLGREVTVFTFNDA